MNLKIKYLHILLAAFASILLASCSDSNKSDEPDEPDNSTNTTPRTVLVYMVANNTLGSAHYDDDDIEEMTQAALNGSFGKSRLVVYHASYNGDAPQLKEIKADGTIEVLKSYESGTGKSVTIERMRQVIEDMKEAAPANDYGLVLWSHANGWVVDGVDESSSSSAPKKHYSYGQDSGLCMNVSSLADAIDGAGFSFLYFDCCFMGGVEVVYELRNVAKTAVVSAAEVALSGMPYHLSLKYLMSETVDPVAAARTTYEYYQDQESEYDRSCTISVVDLTAMDALATATRSVYAAAAEPVPDGYEKHPFCNRSPYKYYYFDFANYVDALTEDDSVARAAWHTAFDNAVIYKAQTQYFQLDVDLSVHCGLSTYIFESADNISRGKYQSTSWYADVASALIK